MSRGLVHVYFGEGKGKTTASLGLILRALGWKRKVCLFMFLKPKSFSTGEIKSLEKLPNLKIHRYNQIHPYFWHRGVREWRNLIKEVRKSLEDLDTEIKKGYDLIVLDEILNLLKIGFVNERYLLELIKNKSPRTEIVFTGRECPPSLKKSADYLIQFRSIKHPYEKGISARKGVEY